MPGTNQFPPFAVGGGANVLSPAAWAALTALLTNGFQTGVADSAQVNTAIRHGVFGMAALAQIVSDYGANALDDGNLATFVTNLKTALTASAAALPGGANWQTVNGGLILQWSSVVNAGSVIGTAVTFPVPFPTACFGVQSTFYTGTTSSKSGADNNDTYANLTRFGFDIQNEGTLATSIFYFALGK